MFADGKGEHRDRLGFEEVEVLAVVVAEEHVVVEGDIHRMLAAAYLVLGTVALTDSCGDCRLVIRTLPSLVPADCRC